MFCDKLLAWGAKPDNPSVNGPQPLAWAVVTGRMENIHRLLAAGSDPLLKPRGQESALGVAGRFGELAAAKTLLMAVKDRSRLKKDDSPLRAAARRGHAEIVQLFLDAGMPVNLRDVHDTIPLHEAVRSDSADVTQVLLNAGAEVNARDKAGYTPLHNAAESLKPQHVPVLLQHKADIEIATLEGFTPFMIAVERDVETMKLLMKAGAKIDRFAVTGFNALHSAASTGCAEAVQLLLQAGMPVDSTTRHSGSTALHLTAGGGGAQRDRFKSKPREINGMKLSEPRYPNEPEYLKTVQILLEAGAKVSSVNKEGFTPLHSAAQYDQTDIARVLLSKGGRVDAMGSDDRTPLHLAAGAASPAMIDLLLDHGADIEVEQNSHPSKFTPLMWAVQFGKPDNVKRLLERRADIKHGAFGKRASALHVASMVGHVDIARMLVAAGIAVDAHDSDQLTPLMAAAQMRQIEMVRWLLEQGADVNARATTGASALMIAIRTGNTELAALLRKHGAR